MDSSGVKVHVSLAEITRTYQRAAGRWQGCDWPTAFGRFGLDLKGLRSAQATLMAGATAGEEATEWRRAARWLDRIEQDAASAQRIAHTAVALAANDCWEAAARYAHNACTIEAKYHGHLVWKELRDLIAEGSREAEPADGGR